MWFALRLLLLLMLVFSNTQSVYVIAIDNEEPFSGRFYLPIKSNLCENKNGIVADPHDCRIYYVCYYDRMVYKRCDENTYFSIEAGKCLHNILPPGCQTFWKPPEPSTTTMEPTTPTESPVTPQPDVQSICLGQPNGFTYQLETNCRSYAVCWQDQSHSGECPTGFSYNDERRVCDIANNFQCELDHLCPPYGIHAFRKIGSCSEYNLCYAGVHTTRSCLSGLHFDSSQNRCTSPEVARCNDCPVTDDPEAIVTFGSPDKNEYYICHDAELVAFRCASGLQWNQEKQQCDFYHQHLGQTEFETI